MVNFSRGGVVCKAWTAGGTPGDDSESPHRRGIRGTTHFKQTFHPRVFLGSAFGSFHTPVVLGRSLFIAPCRYRKIGNSTPGARRSFSRDVIGVKTSPSVRRRREAVSSRPPAPPKNKASSSVSSYFSERDGKKRCRFLSEHLSSLTFCSR